MADLDNEFKAFLLGVAPRPQLLERLQSAYADAANARTSLVESNRAQIRKTSERLDREQQELIRMRTQQLIGDDEFRTQRAAIMNQRQSTSIPIKAARSVPDIQVKMRDISRPLYSLCATWQHAPMSLRPRFQRIILPIGFPAGKVRTAQRAHILRLEEVFADEEDGHVPLTISRLNQIEKEIMELWDILNGHEEGDDTLPVAA